MDYSRNRKSKLQQEDRWTRSYDPLTHSSANRPEIGIYFSGRAAHDESDNGVSGDFDVLEGAEDVDFPSKRDIQD